MIRKRGIRRYLFVILAIIVLSVTFGLGGCYEGDPFPDGWFERVFVGDPTTTSVAANRYGGIIASGSIRSESAVTAVTYEEGTGLWISEYGTLEPEHSAVGSFDLTGGAYDNLFTSTTPIFTIADSDDRNFLVILSEENYGQVAEIVIFVDASNVVLQTTGWTADIVNADFVIFQHPLFFVGDGGRISMRAMSGGNVEIESMDYTNGALFTTRLDAGVDGVGGILLEVDANGYSGIEAIDIDYHTGDLQPGDHASVIKVELNDTDASASDATTVVDFINILTLDEHDLVKHAIHVGQGFDNAFHVSSGTEEDPDHGYEVTPDVPVDRVTGIAPDGTAFLEASASNVMIFDADDDYILIGSDATFEAIDAFLVNGANRSIIPEWYYSTGAGTWATLVVSETTHGFTESGIITFNAPAAWALSNLTLPAGAAINNAFYVKIVRTRNNIGAPPIEDYFKTYTSSSTTDFEIRGDGTIRPVQMADAAASNHSLYFSTTQNKLVYKDGGGVVHDLW